MMFSFILYFFNLIFTASIKFEPFKIIKMILLISQSKNKY